VIFYHRHKYLLMGFDKGNVIFYHRLKYLLMGFDRDNGINTLSLPKSFKGRPFKRGTRLANSRQAYRVFKKVDCVSAIVDLSRE
jgi:hypothetical protein